jgi:hypothetical protein
VNMSSVAFLIASDVIGALELSIPAYYKMEAPNASATIVLEGSKKV